MEHIDKLKLAVAAICAALTSLWGWFGWLCVLLMVVMLVDYLTGSAAAKVTGTWSSAVARAGLWHKLGTVVAVLVAAILDIVLGAIINHIPAIVLPWEYTVLFSPLVVVWYIITELGSVLENSGKMGGPQPEWFRRAVSALTKAVDSVGDATAKDSGDHPPGSK